MASTRTKTATKPAADTNGNVSALPSFASAVQFTATEAPVVKSNGKGRPANPEMVILVTKLETLPLVEDYKDTDGGWFAVTVPDVSTFADLVRQAGVKMGCSFQLRHQVTVTKDDTLNPGEVKLRRIPRRVRGPRKAKA